MSGEAQSPADFRNLIRQKADFLAPGDPDDLQNIITSQLPNGAKCYVVERRSTFVYNRYSSLSPNGIEVFAPIAGGGRWLLSSVDIAGSPIIEAYSTNPNTFVVDGNLNAPNTAQFTTEAGPHLTMWTLTALGCVLQYNGPDTPAWAILTASVSVANADALRSITGFISHNDDDPGAVVGTTIGGPVQVVQTVANQVLMLVAQRRIPSLQSLNTIRPKFSGIAGGVTGVLASLQLTVRPG